MNIQADKTQENSNQSFASADLHAQSCGESVLKFADNRPEAIAQRKLQELVNNSPQVKLSMQLRALVNNNQQLPFQKKNNPLTNHPAVVQRVFTANGYNYDTLADLDAETQELYYDSTEDVLNEITGQLDELDVDALSEEDQGHLSSIRNKIDNAWNIYGHKENAEDGWADQYGAEPGEGDSLHDLVYNVIVDAIGDRTTIAGMSYDQVYGYNAETQIAFCLEKCRNESAEALALCLYTSYFYEPLNSYFRGLSQPDPNTNFGYLVIRTAEILNEAYAGEADTDIADRRYRVELRSGWIPDGEVINFAAPISTHPNLAGVKAMWPNVADGTFGPYDNLAVLIFEGTAKIKRPQQKYFTDETEDIIGPGTQYNITDQYTLQGNINGIVGQQQIRVFHLSNVEDAVAGARVVFGDIV